MRVCLVGTSNAIYKDGYAAAIQNNPDVTDFTKHSIGASPSVIIPYFLSNIDFKNFDIVIFDTAINDRNYYISKSIRKEQIREFLEWGIQKASAAGCRVGLLLMPTRTAFQKETISGLIYTKLADETGSLLFDGYKDAKAIAKFIGCPIDILFNDDYHYLKPFAWRLAKDMISALIDADRPLSIDKILPDFYKIHLSTLPYQTPIMRKTSAIERRFVGLTSDIEISIPLGEKETLVGISFNAANSFGSLKISGTKTHIKSLTTQFTGSGKPLQLIVVPFTTPDISSSDGQIALSLASETDTCTEPGRFDPSNKDLHIPQYLEIEDIIIRRGFSN